MGTAKFTPALGYASLTPLYDFVIRLLTREQHWRAQLLKQVAPKSGEAILDVGCGTGTFALELKRRAPEARVFGIDPDPAALSRAAAKSEAAGLRIEWLRGFAHEVADFAGDFDKVVSSLVFHQVPMQEKSAGLAAMLTTIRPGGEIHIADYACQHTSLMRQLFRVIQVLDGRTNTQLNADGAVERILSDLNGSPVLPEEVVRTPTGAISLFFLHKSGGDASQRDHVAQSRSVLENPPIERPLQ